MLELRKHYFLDRWVLISTERARRPQDFKQKYVPVSGKRKCPFCPGNEHMTPPEIARVEKNGKWIMRVFPNKFPAVTLKGGPEIVTEKNIFSHGNSFGQHEVVVETPNHEEQLADLPFERIVVLFKLLVERIKELQGIDGVKYVCVFKNKGREAGTSLEHSHFQIIAFNVVPSAINSELNAVKKFRQRFKKCPYCEILKLEKNSQRKILLNDSVFAYAPYASRFAFEVAIIPRKHKSYLSELNEKELFDLAKALKKVLVKLKKLNAPYNLYLHEPPQRMGKGLHFHIKITPRLLSWGGFEMHSRCIINTVSPEQAAKFFRGK